jgi:hypothetical protein
MGHPAAPAAGAADDHARVRPQSLALLEAAWHGRRVGCGLMKHRDTLWPPVPDVAEAIAHGRQPAELTPPAC